MPERKRSAATLAFFYIYARNKKPRVRKGLIYV